MFQGEFDLAYSGRLNILLKDLGIAVDVARASGSALPLTGLIDNLFRMLHVQPVR